MGDARKLSMSDFYSRKKANEGKKLLLKTPNGEVTEHWFRVVNCDSDVMAKAHADSRTALVENKMSAKPDPDFASKVALDNIASAVVEWSFEEPISKEAVREFLTEAPHIKSDVDDLIYDRKAFFGGAE